MCDLVVVCKCVPIKTAEAKPVLAVHECVLVFADFTRPVGYYCNLVLAGQLTKPVVFVGMIKVI